MSEPSIDEIPPIPETARIHQNERTAARNVEGKAVVVVIDTQKLHVMNSVGSRIWELADGRPLSEIVNAVTTEFDVERDRALGDTREFIGELWRLGALNVRKD